MAPISACSLIRVLSLFHITIAYFLLTSPSLVAKQQTVMILGEAMQLPDTSDFSRPSEATAFCALILGFYGVSDLLGASLPDLTALEYWLGQIPVRLIMLFGLSGYTYLFKDGGYFGSKHGVALGYGMSSALRRDRGPGELIKNNLVFTAAFLEVCVYFWIFFLLGEERKAASEKLLERKKAQEELFDGR